MPKIYRSSVIDKPVEAVWDRIRDFNALPEWLPGIAVSEIEHSRESDAVGCVRRFSLADGGEIREQQLALSDLDHTCTYSILEAPLPLENYVATLSLKPITDGNRTFIEWTAEFDCAPEETEGLIALVGDGIFQGGFDNLK